MSKSQLQLLFGQELAGELSGLNLNKIGFSLGSIIGLEEMKLEEDEEINSINVQDTPKQRLKLSKKGIKAKDNLMESLKDIDQDDDDMAEEPQLLMTENDLGLEVLAEEMGEKIYRLTDLFIPQNNKLRKKIEKYNMRLISNIEKTEVDVKKEDMEEEEIKNLVYKSKKNQKYIKVNYSYNEKFFDKTCFLDDFKENYKNHPNENHPFLESLGLTSYVTLNEITKQSENQPLYDELNLEALKDQTEIKLLTSIHDTKLLLEEANELPHCLEEIEKDASTLAPSLKTYFEETDTFAKEVCDKDLESENEEEILGVLGLNASTFDNVKINSNSTGTLLYDRLKRKRYRYPKKQNDEINRGWFLNSLITDDVTDPHYNEKFNNFIRTSKRIYDLNDYNMNFELADTNKSMQQDESSYNALRKKSDDITGIIPGSKEELLLNNFIKKVTLPSFSPAPQSQMLKIGKFNKSNIITHAKCANGLNYNKLNLELEELKNFHRPDFSKYLFNIKKKCKTSFKIGGGSHLIPNPNSVVKEFPVQVRTRQFLKNKEKKRIQKNIQYMNACEVFKNHHKLSLNEGKFCLFEHIDEEPLFISNFGMASKIKKYLLSNRLFNSYNNSKLSESELKTAALMGPNGIQLPIQDGQKLPLLGQLDKTDLKGVAVFDNKMYKAPLFYEKYADPIFHKKLLQKDKAEVDKVLNTPLPKEIKKKKVSLSKRNLRANAEHNSPQEIPLEDNVTKPQETVKRMQFLLTFRKINPSEKEKNDDKDGEGLETCEKFYIREMDHLYTIGQQEPKIEVYPPQSKQYNNFLKKKIQTYTERIYDEVGYRSGINFRFFTNLFPTVTEQILKKHFKEFGIDIDKNICFYNNSKPIAQRGENTITPENICQYESCLHGVFKLRQLGIRNLTNSDKISYATNKFVQSIKDVKQQFLAKVIEEELLTTPWNLTMNYLQAKQINGMLSIKGIGDPSNGNGGYSFIKMPVKQYNTDNKTLKDEIDILKEQNKNIKTVTGTDADLRKLSKQDIKMKLIQLGFDEEQINNLTRWERVALLRYKSSIAADMGYQGDITKYARGDRVGTSVQREAYQQNINEVFKIFIDYIQKQQLQTLELNETNEEVLDSVPENMIEDFNQDELPIYDKSLSFAKVDGGNNLQVVAKKKKKDRLNSSSKNDKLLKLYSKEGEDPNMKIKLDLKRDDIEFLRQKKRRTQGFNKVFEFEFEKSTPLISRKRRSAPERKFNEIIEDIIDSCIKTDKSKLFHLPVKKKEIPDYYDKISKPMDLGTMKNKTKRNEYLTTSGFEEDIQQMVINSEIYNGAESLITHQVYLIQQHAKEQLRLREKELDDNDPEKIQ